MIGVTSRIASAADAPPSAAPNTGAAPAAGADAPAAPVPAAGPEAAPPSNAPAPLALPAAPLPPAPATTTVNLTAPQPAPNQPITSKWWFWTAIGAAVVGGVVAIYLVSRTPSPPACPTAMGFVCPR